jgi:hypothetical protein
MPSPGMRGWYVELDEQLVAEFDKAFPEHGAKARLTESAVIFAVQTRLPRVPDVENLKQLTTFLKDFLAPEGDNVSRQRGNQGEGGRHAG